MASRIVLNTISYHGHGAIENIVPELTSRGYKKAFVCSDPDLIKFGVTKKVTDLLDAAGFAYAVYSEIKPNPTIQNVQDGVAAFKAAEADCIVTIGGGSSMDTAKAIGIIINNPEFADVRSLEGVAPTKKHAVFTIAVPTTAGTAAEVTINYVITDVEKKRKFVCVDTNDIPEVAVVDPDMMSSMPKGLTAATGMDALTHAIEGYITKGHCTISDMFHLEAIKLISENLRGAVQNTPEGREGMALGQYIAGMGFSNVGLGIVHSMAHGLSALYDTPHGVACAIILPTGLEYNKAAAGERYRAGEQLVRARLEQDFAAIHHHDFLKQPGYLVDQVRGNDDGARVIFKIVDHLVVKPFARHRVQPQGGLVEDRKIRARSQPDHQPQRRYHAAGKLPRLLARVQFKGFQQGLRVILIPIGVKHPAQPERLAHAQIARVRRLFPHHAQSLLHRRMLVARTAKNQRLPLRREQQPADYVEQRRFPRAIAAQREKES